ncbi:phosphoglucosamine mutase [Halorubellus sp. JP-L1]|uniref:phosphoglucosamine mutase n=1 Tax=Halorubellus sp. JP-L1 TaxID=2715753 RepID=UPI00140C023D|nr:phosphoglucosamine mutase [Halorubellus sp. JP-L1]NHN40674.1 phosphoglucosamine mutase [Halorubellus sp. JP-L1]
MFGTSGIRGRVGDEVTCALALSVGRAVAAESYERVVVGRDPRESGEMLADAVAAGLREGGADVVRVGQAATPTVARAVGWTDADVGVSVTASHNPAPDNGLKLWTATGRAFDVAQQDAIARRVREDDYDLVGADALGTESRLDDATERHVRALQSAVDADLAGLSVVVDVGNGAGGVTATVLDRLGASVQTLNAQPDGTFPGRPSEPTAEHCGSLSALVAATDADLGIAHDGDADRTMAVTADGEFLPGDVLLAIFATAAAGEGDVVAAPLNTSLAVDDALAEVGASLVHTKVGDGFVAERTEDDDVVFGGEMSGAWIWPDQTKCPDGPLAAVRLGALVADHGPLAELAADVPTYPTCRDSVEVDDKRAVMRYVADAVHADHDPGRVNDRDGVRVDTDDGWFLVRASGTQPLVRVTAEARDADRSDALAARARAYLDDAVAALESEP